MYLTVHTWLHLLMNCLLHSYRLELWDERPRAKLVLFIKDRIELPQRVPLPSLVQAYYNRT